MSYHSSVGNVTTVHHRMARGSKHEMVISDLIFIGTVPFIVTHWQDYPDGKRPQKKIPLNSHYLHKDGSKAEYSYEQVVEAQHAV